MAGFIANERNYTIFNSEKKLLYSAMDSVQKGNKNHQYMIGIYEVVEGKWILNYEPKNRLPIEEFLKTQARFKHLFKPENEHLIEKYQAEVDRRWEDLLFKCSR